MSVIRIEGVESDGGLRWEIDLDGHLHDVYLRSNEALALDDSAFPLALFTSMVKGEPVDLVDPRCETLFENSKNIVDLFRRWFPEFKDPQFVGQGCGSRGDRAKDGRVGLFFTGGVDSFYSLLENQREITDLIFVHGFDIELKNHELRNEVSRAIHEAAGFFGKNLIEIETNIRRYLGRGLRLPWPYSHGVALATVAHSLARGMSKIYISSSHTYPDYSMWGTHPDVDPHWSSSALQVVHYGFQANRIDKLRRIAQSEFALSKIRVCYENRSNDYNCGECEKCIRTLLAMKIVGCTDGSDAFASPFSPEKLKTIDRLDPVSQHYLRENRDALIAQGGDPELLKLLNELLTPPTWVETTLHELGQAKPVKRLMKRLRRKGKRP